MRAIRRRASPVELASIRTSGLGVCPGKGVPASQCLAPDGVEVLHDHAVWGVSWEVSSLAETTGQPLS